ncbi:hypothetical protein Gotri_024887 [Gossypium trilobum]|uniref:Uncharacterized protein n=1 Tax=Gossypium trilobum TaxID=34281 RepID=A0A7J9FWR8_9ROSI|nr:hypothetical protein [Gossypium trilobum]
MAKSSSYSIVNMVILLYFGEGRLGAHRRRVHNSTLLPDDPSRQFILEPPMS